MQKKVLVAYASKYGSTGEVAQAIADQLCKRGVSADVRPVDEVTDLLPYGAFIVGSAIRMGRWLQSAVNFVETHADTLRQTPTSFFTVHMLNRDDSEESRQARAAYMEPVHAVMMPQSEAFFAGKIAVKDLTFLDRLIARMVKAEDADDRDWQAIAAWADQITLH